ncbi:MAG: hypothetical protein HC924_09265 [Synechococcaceae cyanobacterium SM2_3_2]|nr:hypothetical protein [Synechococcaceae cyanobacterium SM2_3_2]
MNDDWINHTCQVEVPVGIDQVWDLWADLSLIPNWMKWIRSVEMVDKDLSRWTLDTRGLTFSWISNTHTVIEHQIIGWRSVDGLANQGTLRFYPRKESTIVRLTISYVLPGFLRFMDTLFLGKAVESTIQADMERFRDYAVHHSQATSGSPVSD